MIGWFQRHGHNFGRGAIKDRVVKIVDQPA
jgi:hypothetical protein